MMITDKVQEITIAGAGLVGSLLGILLSRRGYSVQIFERRSDPRATTVESGRSINLIVTSRGLEGLRQAGLREQALKLCVPVYGREIHSKTGPSRYQPYGRNQECNYAISRWDLNNFLITEALRAGVKIAFDTALEDVDFERKTLSIQGRPQRQYEVLIGTDGANSAVRKALLKSTTGHETSPKSTTALPVTETIDWLESDYKELHMTADKAKDLREGALHIWPHGTHMMMGLSNLDGSMTMTLYMPQKRSADSLANFEDCASQAVIEQLFERDFKDLIERIPNYVSQFKNNPQGRLGTVRLSRWISANHAAVMGDAAHAIVPFFGQGMNCGFEDATALLDLLAQHEAKHTDWRSMWSSVFEKYDRERRPNANAIADMALENYIEMRDRVADPQFHEMKRLEVWIEENFPEYISRYRLITYTLTPYAKAQQIGKRQAALLESLAQHTPIGRTPDRALVEQWLSKSD